ncbi:MAG TPA: DUF6263 family protein [Chitinophagaceae bacterium]|nr:DUF6263 family protein [Chitinophagaceae bacterium]
MKNLIFPGALALTIITGCSHKITGNAASSATTTVAPKPTGEINLQKGQAYNVESKLTTSSSSEVQGQTMETSADVTSVYNLAVNDATGDKYKMSNKIASIKMSMNTMGQSINFDSDNKEDMNGEIGSNLKGFINQPQQVTKDKWGNNKTDSTQAADSTTKSDTNPTAIMLKQMGDPAAQGYGAKLAFRYFPRGTTAGTTWQDSTSKDGTTTVTNFTIKEVNGDTATIQTSGTDNRETKTEVQGMEIQTKTTGVFSGEEFVNIKTGVISKTTSTMNAKGTVSVMGQDIPTTIKVTSVNTVTQQ